MQEEVLAIDSDSCPKPPQEHVSRGKEWREPLGRVPEKHCFAVRAEEKNTISRVTTYVESFGAFQNLLKLVGDQPWMCL